LEPKKSHDPASSKWYSPARAGLAIGLRFDRRLQALVNVEPTRRPTARTTHAEAFAGPRRNIEGLTMGLPEDPRRRNSQFSLETIEAHVRGYGEALSRALVCVDWRQLELAIAAIDGARTRHARLWVAGNGGSAAIADHLLCDWVKGTFTSSQAPIRVHSLTSDTALLTACANDFGYEVSLSRQIEMQAQSGDVLICISSSGNSANILAALRVARHMGLKSIAFTGFDGGEAARLADISLHIPARNYGVVEDCHQILMHNIAQYIYGRSTRGG
jgi:D-sedoheptulose 7-phosphate isomerase